MGGDVVTGALAGVGAAAVLTVVRLISQGIAWSPRGDALVMIVEAVLIGVAAALMVRLLASRRRALAAAAVTYGAVLVIAVIPVLTPVPWLPQSGALSDLAVWPATWVAAGVLLVGPWSSRP